MGLGDEGHSLLSDEYRFLHGCQVSSFSFLLLLSSQELSDTHVYEPEIRAFLGTASHFCEVVVLKLPGVIELGLPWGFLDRSGGGKGNYTIPRTAHPHSRACRGYIEEGLGLRVQGEGARFQGRPVYERVRLQESGGYRV